MRTVMENACLGTLRVSATIPPIVSGLIRHDLATPHAQVVYDSQALTISGKSRGEFDNVPFILALVHRPDIHGN